MYRRILVVVSDRPEAREAVTQGVELARVHAAEVLLFSVLPRHVGSVAEMTPVAPMPPSRDVEREWRRHPDRQRHPGPDHAGARARAGVPRAVAGS